MDARYISLALAIVSMACLAAGHRTENFIVSAPSEELAQRVAERAERLRDELALTWTGSKLPAWQDKCSVTVLADSGQAAMSITTFDFDHSRPVNLKMIVCGNEREIFESHLPHEVTHTVLATHFGRPLPKWIDEGICITAESRAERRSCTDLLYTVLSTNRGVAFDKMFTLSRYPEDLQPIYAQGYSLVQFLVNRGGRRQLLEYVADGSSSGQWADATRNHYGFDSLTELQEAWLEWVRDGLPKPYFGPLAN